MRLPPRALRAFRSRELKLLASPCRDLMQAKAELRWIREHCDTERAVLRMCEKRHRHVPLQYLLASQPFGPFDLQCRPGVLIPRWETEAWAAQLAEETKPGSKVLDLCTGSGCIALMLAQKPGSVTGIDLSPLAIKLAQQNLRRNSQLVHAQVAFKQLDIFSLEAAALVRDADVLVANPPYIDHADQSGLSLSTRRYEPHLALLATDQGDAFYRHIAMMLVTSKARLVALEIGSSAQAARVSTMLPSIFKTEVWQDATGAARVVLGRRRDTSASAVD